MAFMQYDLINQHDGNDGFVRVTYEVSYDPVKNQTTVTFPWDDYNHRLRGNLYDPCNSKTEIAVKADGGNTAISTMEVSLTGNGGYQLRTVQPDPNVVVVQHSDVAGKKSVTITASTTYITDNTAYGSGSVTIEVGERVGYYCIDNGSKILQCIPYIDNGSKWLACIPYIDNGSAWKSGS